MHGHKKAFVQKRQWLSTLKDTHMTIQIHFEFFGKQEWEIINCFYIFVQISLQNHLVSYLNPSNHIKNKNSIIYFLQIQL